MKVLVVEDEKKTAEYLRKGLSEHGFVVDVATNGEDGLHLATTTEVALGKSRSAEEYRVVLESGLEEYERLTRVIENLLFLARADKARSFHPQGTGLGLAIVTSIMDLHSGSVAIESAPGEGTTVKLSFPRA